MKFSYQSYPVRGAGADRYAIVHRPMIHVRVVGPMGADDIMGLADTGADDTLLPDLLIRPLGVLINPDDRAIIASFSSVLGHEGFFDYFTATFNGRRRHLTLTPNGTAPAPTRDSD